MAVSESNGQMMDANVCAMVARNGDVNAEFSGNAYVDDVVAQGNINLTSRGKYLIVNNLGDSSSSDFQYKNGDYYGTYNNVYPEHAALKALDLANVGNTNEHPHGTVVVKNGKLNGEGNGRIRKPNATQDIEVIADHAYLGGYEFIMDPHAGTDGKVTYKEHPGTSKIKNVDGTTSSIRVETVEPEDVSNLKNGNDPNRRIYYRGNGINGSVQEDDPNYDGDDKDDDNIVLPEPEPDPTEPPEQDDDNDSDADADADADGDNDTDADNDNDGDADNDADADSDADSDSDPNPDKEKDPDPAQDSRGPSYDTNRLSSEVQKRDVAEVVPAIDKRQYMRFNANNEPITMEPNENLISILDISRGGMAVSHSKQLKVGDVIPVNFSYGNMNVNADVKVVSASDRRAGTQFVNLTEATANQLLYMSLIMEGNNTRPQ